MPPTRRSIIAHHLILPLYGHWAPNDLRGSGSARFYDEKFQALGAIHFGRKPSVEQPSREELRAFHRKFRALLRFPVFWIDGAKRQALAGAFGETMRIRNYTCYGCAICSNHAHLIIRIHRDNANIIWDALTADSRLRLRLLSPDIEKDHPIWAERPYKVFLYTPEDIRRLVRYIEQNPEKEGLPPQNWDFTTPYNNWPHHPKRVKICL